ncbi:hypothetical protein [Dendrosporobacter sp. 1207_IL3150]|uniref:hypothetical protein n=1 Tax=Dendrosporobacter sp. 1207_IL3150 TaxID=3084054 RepID=UPI002FDA5974
MSFMWHSFLDFIKPGNIGFALVILIAVLFVGELYGLAISRRRNCNKMGLSLIGFLLMMLYLGYCFLK